jgi:hypothetical protein
MNLAAVVIVAILPGWMSGTWRQETAAGITEETWSRADGTTMTGMHRNIRPGKKTWFEFLRIEQRGQTLVYVAQPAGAPPTEFPATSVQPDRIVFENPNHDFPKRITYWKQEAELCARVEGDGEKAQQWCWSPAP